ncbi:MAG: sortase [Candidatus Dojkabacteria bacterium]|nr:sortase [Candidatus Dojkabacteria bacterium]
MASNDNTKAHKYAIFFTRAYCAMIFNENLDYSAQMTLYYYKKAPPKSPSELADLENKKHKQNSPTLATVLDNITYSLKSKISTLRPISIIIPLMFIVSGLGILYRQVKPYALHYLQAKFTDRLDQEVISLVPTSYDQIRAEYISDPAAGSFNELVSGNKINKEALDYSKTFYLTIDKIQIYDAPVIANVDSTKEDIYKDALGRGLAHFRGTDLPNGNRNVLIYGHSAAGDYAEKNPGDVITAFTRLFKLNIGDPITVKFENQEYKYTVKKIKEVYPQDVDVIVGEGSKTLTLMTCSPPGLNSRRLVVIAVPSI